jgi:hypothetical protein
MDDGMMSYYAYNYSNPKSSTRQLDRVLSKFKNASYKSKKMGFKVSYMVSSYVIDNKKTKVLRSMADGIHGIGNPGYLY